MESYLNALENDFQIEPPRRTTQLDFAIEALRNAILNGELKLGERVNEVTLTTKLGISRTTFREALRQMEQAGLLVRVPFRGTFVRDFSEEEIDDINNLRSALETYAAEMIIESGRNRREDLAPLYQIVEQMDKIDAEKDAAQTNMMHIKFHDALLNLGGSKALSAIWNDLALQFWVTMRVSQLSFFEQGEAGSFAASHREIVDALAGGDLKQFRQVIRAHVSHPQKFPDTPKGVPHENHETASSGRPDRRVSD